VDEIIDGNPVFNASLPPELNTTDFGFIQPEMSTIKTRAVTTCLVTHRKYSDAAGLESFKIGWVRHVVHQVLRKLSMTGLRGSSAGEQWKVTAQLLERTQGGDGGLTWDSFGWPLHDDKLLLEMLTAWKGNPPQLIDPDNPF